MSRQNKQTLVSQVYDVLQSQNGFGRSKHDDKILGCDSKYIYSYSTMKTYIKHDGYFVKWCLNNPDIKDALGHKPRTLDECKPYVEQYIRHREESCSAYTVKMELSALSKLYQEKFDIQTKATARADIVRSRRDDVGMDKHFSESKNADMVNACKCTGLRRMEFEKASGKDLVLQPDGSFAIKVIGKGGRERLAPIIGTEEQVRSAVNYIYNKDKGKAHAGADIHSYRADYATAIYKANARPIDQLKGLKIDYTALTGKTDKHGNRIYKSALYVCRGDRKGDVMDREAMIKASQALGHNRESVVGEHYIRL